MKKNKRSSLICFCNNRKILISEPLSIRTYVWTSFDMVSTSRILFLFFRIKKQNWKNFLKHLMIFKQNMILNVVKEKWENSLPNIYSLTHFRPMLGFYTPSKLQETFSFQRVKKWDIGWNGLNIVYETLYAIWYHLYNLKIVKNNHGEMLLLVKLQAWASTLLKVTLLHGCFWSFLNCTNGTKSRKASPLSSRNFKKYTSVHCDCQLSQM